MIQMQTNLDVADNSGARRVQCIKVLGGSKRKYASVGDVNRRVGQGSHPDAAASKRATSARAVVVRTAEGSASRRRYSHSVRPERRCYPQSTTTNPVGTRIFGPVVRELRGKNFMKIISLAPEVL